jgi:hypothetical protein
MLADPEPLTINCPIAFAKLILRPAVPVRAGGESSRGKAVASAKLILRLAVPLAVTPPTSKPEPSIVGPALNRDDMPPGLGAMHHELGCLSPSGMPLLLAIETPLIIVA